jgi:capsular polysaccharide biosynthesis protein
VSFCGKGSRRGGATELARVLAQAFSDLVLTALKERSTLLAARSAYSLFVDPRIAVRAMVVAVVLVAVAVTLASSTRMLMYEASAQVWVDQKQGVQQTYVTGSGEEIQTLPPKGEGLQTIILTMIHAIDSRPLAEEVIGRLGLRMEPAELLDNLAIEQVDSTSFIRLTYKGTDPYKATQIVNTVGEVSSERISETSVAGSNLRATVYTEATVPDSPVSPDPLRNGLLTLVMGLVLCAGLTLALPLVAARVAGNLGRRAVLQGVGQAGVPAVTPVGPSQAEVIKEKELLDALVRRGKLTAVEAALETSLSVEEAERMLQALAAKGHLEVSVERGRLVYALWEHDAPP